MLTILRSADKRGGISSDDSQRASPSPINRMEARARPSAPRIRPSHHLRLGMDVAVGFQSGTLFGMVNGCIPGHQQCTTSACSISNTGASRDPKKPAHRDGNAKSDGWDCCPDRFPFISHRLERGRGAEGQRQSHVSGVELDVVLAPCRAEKAIKLHSSQTGAA